MQVLQQRQGVAQSSHPQKTPARCPLSLKASSEAARTGGCFGGVSISSDLEHHWAKGSRALIHDGEQWNCPT